MLNKETTVSIGKILKYARLKSELSADELKLADLLVAITESDRLAIIELWGMKSKPASKPATKRVIEKCASDNLGYDCGLTRRAAIHKDVNVDGYHEFRQPELSSKSKRASLLAGAIKKATGKEPRCVACFETRDHTEHDVANGGHEFTTDLAGRVNEVLDGHNDDDYSPCAKCGELSDNNVHHKRTDVDYHEFVGSETAVGVGGD